MRRGVHRILLGIYERKRRLGRHRHRWVYNITVDLEEVNCGDVHWIMLAEDRDRRQALVNAVMNIRVPYNAMNFLTV